MIYVKLENEVALGSKPMAAEFLSAETTATHLQLNLGQAQAPDKLARITHFPFDLCKSRPQRNQGS
jgi:hypothetical protein